MFPIMMGIRRWLVLAILLLQVCFKAGVFADNVTILNNMDTILMSTNIPHKIACQIASTDVNATSSVTLFIGGDSYNFEIASECSKSENNMTCSTELTADFISTITNVEDSLNCLSMNNLVPFDVPYFNFSRSDSTPYKIFYAKNLTLDYPLIGTEGDTVDIKCSISDTNWIDPSMTFNILNSSFSQALACVNTSLLSYTCTGAIRNISKSLDSQSAQCIFSTKTFFNISIASDTSAIIVNSLTTLTPTQQPTQVSTQATTQQPTQVSTQAPTQQPTQVSTQAPTQQPTQVSQSPTKVSATTVAPIAESSSSDGIRNTIILVVVLPTVGIAAIAIIVFLVKFISHTQTMAALEATYQPNLLDVEQAPTERPLNVYNSDSMAY